MMIGSDDCAQARGAAAMAVAANAPRPNCRLRMEPPFTRPWFFARMLVVPGWAVKPRRRIAGQDIGRPSVTTRRVRLLEQRIWLAVEGHRPASRRAELVDVRLSAIP